MTDFDRTSWQPEEEKRLIGEIANSAARMENVDNQLEVKTTNSDSR